MGLLENVLRKIFAESYVQFINGQLVFKDGAIDLGQTVGGNSSIQRAAYASSIDGAGFTLINDPLLEYMAFALLPADATPVVANFAGQWFHRRGLPGASPTPIPGANGQQAGFRINFSVATDAAKPGTGKVAFNHPDLSQATEMYLDEMTPWGTDLSGVINQLTSNMTFTLNLNSASSETLAAFQLGAAPTDNGDWFTIPVTNTAKSSTNFADGDQCVFQFFGGNTGGGAVTEAAILAAGPFLRAVDNGAGGYKIIDNTNEELKASAQVFTLPGITILGVQERPDANTFPHGTVIRLHQDVLVGAGVNSVGLYLEADAVNNVWLPFGHQLLFWNNFGTFAAPTNSLTAAGKFALGAGGDPVFPGYLFNVGSKVKKFFRYRKLGTTTPTLRMNFGTDLSARENNSIIYSQSPGAGANTDMPARSEVTFISTTSAIATNRAADGGGGGASSSTDAVTLINTAAPMRLTFEASVLSADTVYLIECGAIWIK